MTEPQFEYSIEPEKWPDLLTEELDGHFSRMGEESVQWDVSNHRYGTPEKHYAALYWLGQKRKARQRLNVAILVVAVATLIVSFVAWLNPFAGPEQDLRESERGDETATKSEESDFDGFSIVESEDYIACVASQAHWSGMEIVFVRQRRSDGERWLADGYEIQDLAIMNAIVTGYGLYTEYEEDSEHTVEKKSYRFRLDTAKGVLDVWTFEHSGEKAKEGKAFHFSGVCEPHGPAMSP